MSKKIGIAMLIVLIALLFVWVAAMLNVEKALLIFGGSGGLLLWILIMVELLTRKS